MPRPGICIIFNQRIIQDKFLQNNKGKILNGYSKLLKNQLISTFVKFLAASNTIVSKIMLKSVILMILNFWFF